MRYIKLTEVILIIAAVFTFNVFGDIDITVTPSANWGNITTPQIEKLCVNITSHFEEHIRANQKIDANIRVYYDDNGPFVTHAGGNNHNVAISCKADFLNQFTYQFSHELMHILQDYNTVTNHNPNLWFHESLCMLASVWVLKEMGETWKRSPPYPNWRNYAEFHTTYAENAIVKSNLTIPAQRWLTENEDTLRGSFSNFTHHLLVAELSYEFLPIFEETPEAWNAVLQIPAATSNFNQYIRYWYNNVHIDDQKHVEQIANLVGITDITSPVEVDNDLDNTGDTFVALSILYSSDSSILPINDEDEWMGYFPYIWEKSVDGEISNTRGAYTIFDEMHILEHWFYSHAPAVYVFDISKIKASYFSTLLLLPNSRCGGAASVKFIAEIDNKKVYSKEFYLDNDGEKIEFDIDNNSETLKIVIDDLGNQGCDHFVLAEPRLYTDSHPTINHSGIKENINADVNDDGYIDIYDVLIVRSGMHNSVSYDTDLNNDGITDEVDLLIVKAKAMEAIVAASPRKRKVKISTWGAVKQK